MTTEKDDIPLRAPLPPRRRQSDHAPFEQPAFGGAVAAAFDHVVDNRLEGITFADTESICRHFLLHFMAFGGKL